MAILSVSLIRDISLYGFTGFGKEILETPLIQRSVLTLFEVSADL